MFLIFIIYNQINNKLDRASQKMLQQKFASLIHLIKNQNKQKVLQILQMPEARDLLRLQDQTKYTPLFWVCTSFSQSAALEVIPIMIQKGADPYKLDAYHQNILYYIARHEGKDKLLRYLLDRYKYDLNTNDQTRQTPLFFAAANNQIKCAQILLEKGADINHIDNNGQNCLFWSASNGYLQMCKFLVNKGVNFQIKDGNKQTALHYARKKKQLAIIAYLQDLKVNFKKTVKDSNRQKLQSNQQESKGPRKKKQLMKQSYCLIYTNERGEVHQLTYEQLQQFGMTNENNRRALDLIKYPEKLDSHPIPQQKKYEKIANKILTHFMKHQQGFHFLYPVDPIKLNIPHYPNIVKNPMDFSTIKTKLSYNAYDSQLDFNADMNLVFDNCILFNGKQSSYGKIATQMKLEFNTMYKKQFGL